jgi:hypothetical protein
MPSEGISKGIERHSSIGNSHGVVAHISVLITIPPSLIIVTVLPGSLSNLFTESFFSVISIVP